MTTLSIKTPEWFVPLLQPSRYKGIYGGRGSGKSHAIAEYIVERCLMDKTDIVCIREVQKSIAMSVKRLIELKIEAFGLSRLFEVQREKIVAQNGGVIIFIGLQDHTAESIKSLEGFDIAWVEEAQSISQRSLDLLRPTIRKEGSEIIFTWNPHKEDDPVDLLLRGGSAPDGSIVVESNWHNNPWLPDELKNEIEADRKLHDADKFANIWMGKYLKNTDGDYYKNELAKVREQGRICRIPTLDVPVNTFWDIGNSDGCAVWFHQRVGMEDRFIDYYEAHGETLAHYAKELQGKGYLYNKHFMPHDADHKRLSDTNKSVKEMMEGMGLRNVEIVPVITDLNAGIQITRSHFSSAYFDEVKCKAGIKRLENYRKKFNAKGQRWIDEPNKANGCSEAADAFRQWAQAKEAGSVTMMGGTLMRRPKSTSWRTL